jgi:hypothetical protein
MTMLVDVAVALLVYALVLVSLAVLGVWGAFVLGPERDGS